MARTTVPITVLAPDVAVAEPAAVAADPTNQHVVGDGYGTATPVPLEELLVQVTNTSGSTKTVTVLAGTNPPAFEAVLGARVFSVPDGATWWLGPWSSSRFVRSDGALVIDLESGFVGELRAYHLHRG